MPKNNKPQIKLLKEDHYFVPIGTNLKLDCYNLNKILDKEMEEGAISKSTKKKIIETFSNSFNNVAIPKGTPFYKNSNGWYDSIGYGIEQRDDKWAEKYLVLTDDDNKIIINKVLDKAWIKFRKYLKNKKPTCIIGDTCLTIEFFPKNAYSRSYDLYAFEELSQSFATFLSKNLNKEIKDRNLALWSISATDITFTY